jgi:DNA invertase Pin-like site-specific DNA recombinase
MVRLKGSNMTKKAVLYGRISTDEQVKNTSLSDQYAGNKAIADNLGAIVVDAYEDIDSGGY